MVEGTYHAPNINLHTVDYDNTGLPDRYTDAKKKCERRERERECNNKVNEA